MAKAKTALVIVESPAKARTIEKYLGSDYKVVASMGHLRDLPKSTMGVDIEGGFEPQYIPVKGKEDVIKDLRERAEKASMVYLATDPDREGEAIAWHLKELLGLPDGKACRVTFNEITKRVVTESIAAPRDIDIDLVDAQQARRILDRIVGYELSRRCCGRRYAAGCPRAVSSPWPRAWSWTGRRRYAPSCRRNTGCSTPCSAAGEGRVHRPLLTARPRARPSCTARRRRTPSSPPSPGRQFTIESVKRGKKQRSPSPPFITSTLQQEASRRLGMTPAAHHVHSPAAV